MFSHASRYRYTVYILPVGSIIAGGFLGLVSANHCITALVVAGVSMALIALIMFANVALPSAVALFAVTMLPKSLPALNLGNLTFGWGIGDTVVFLTFGLLIFGVMLSRGRLVFSGGLSHIDKAMIAYHIALFPAVVISAANGPRSAIFAIASYVKMVEVLIVYFSVRLTIRSERAARVVMIGFGVTIFGVIAVSVLQLLAPETYIHFLITMASQSVELSEEFLQSVRWRLAGPFLNANTLGVFLILAIAFFSVNLASGRGRFRFHMNALLVVLSTGLLMLTQSRAALLGFGVALLYYLFAGTQIRNMRVSVKWILIGVVSCSYFFWPVLYQRFVDYTFGQGSTPLQSLLAAESTGARIAQWHAGFEAVVYHGLIGVGFGQVAETVGRFLPTGSPFFGGIHQTYLRALLEGGIVEFLGLVYLLSAIWKTSRSLPAAYGVAIRVSLLGLVTTGLFGDTFQNVELMLPFAYLLASLQGLANSRQHREHPTDIILKPEQMTEGRTSKVLSTTANLGGEC